MEGITIDSNDGIATLTLELPGKVNKVCESFAKSLDHGLDKALEIPDLKGIILASGHRDFCVGADIDMLFELRDPAKVFEFTSGLNALYRRLETCGVPVVAAIAGSALGGGYELALACHHRIAIDDAKIQVGLPEVGLGVIPGAGGTQRLPYLMGLQASMEVMAGAMPVRAPKALGKGMVDALAKDVDDLMAQARAWIANNPKPVQPWDQKRWKWPGGVRPGTMEAMQLFVGASGFITKRTAGAFPAAEAIVHAVSDGTRLTFDRALEVESRIFAALAVSDQSKDMIRTLWYHRTEAEKVGVGLEHDFKKVAVLGAGMMGGGLAFLAAKAGLDVVLKDIGQKPLDDALEHCTKEARKLKHMSAQEQDDILSRITYTLEFEPLKGTDLTIEAIIENVGIKHSVIREVEPLLSDNGVFASNTSAIPITMLAEAAKHKDRFIGMHFFSPVEKMPLLEVIKPDACSDDTLQRVLAFGKDIKKTNIVVNDGYAFFTTRVFAAYLLEGCELVAQGHDPVLIEWAARTAGMVMPPLKVFDTVTLTLGVHAFDNREAVMGEPFDFDGLSLVRKLVELGRTGRAAGKGFYDWDTRAIWSGSAELVDQTPEETGLEYLQRRLMVAQAAEVCRVLDDGIIRERRDVDVGAIFGLGFAPNSGGPLAWMDRQGLPELVEEMKRFASKLGQRYAPAPILVRMADKGERFWPSV